MNAAKARPQSPKLTIQLLLEGGSVRLDSLVFTTGGEDSCLEHDGLNDRFLNDAEDLFLFIAHELLANPDSTCFLADTRKLPSMPKSGLPTMGRRKAVRAQLRSLFRMQATGDGSYFTSPRGKGVIDPQVAKDSKEVGLLEASIWNMPLTYLFDQSKYTLKLSSTLFKEEDKISALSVRTVNSHGVEAENAENVVEALKKRLDLDQCQSVTAMSNQTSKHNDAIAAVQSLVSAIESAESPPKHATLFLYTSFNYRPVIERLLTAGASVDLYIPNPNDLNPDNLGSIGSDISHSIVLNLLACDIWVWAANPQLKHAEMSIYRYPAVAASVDMVVIDGLVGVESSHEFGDDCTNTGRPWHHWTPHTVHACPSTSFDRLQARLEGRKSTESSSAPTLITTLSKCREVLHQNNRIKPISDAFFNDLGISLSSRS